MENIVNKIKLAIADSVVGNMMNPTYELKYTPADKETETYVTSRPFDRFEGGFVTYCFGKGIRRFRFDRIVERRVLSLL